MQIALSPELLAQFDLQTVAVQSGSIPDAEHLTDYVPDLLVAVQTKASSSIDVVLIFEHKSGKDPGLMHQLQHYLSQSVQDRVRYVIPVTIYHGRSTWHGEKRFSAFHYAEVPAELRRLCRAIHLDFGTFFVDLGDAQVRVRLASLPLKEGLVLEVLAKVREADVRMYTDWLLRARHLDATVKRSFIGSLNEYLSRTRPEIKISEVRECIQQAMVPGDEAMREVLRDWNEFQPDSAAEARAFGRGEGIEEGKREGIQEGKKAGIQETRCEVAKRMLREGLADADVERYTGLTSTKIARLRNRGI